MAVQSNSVNSSYKSGLDACIDYDSLNKSYDAMYDISSFMGVAYGNNVDVLREIVTNLNSLGSEHDDCFSQSMNSISNMEELTSKTTSSISELATNLGDVCKIFKNAEFLGNKSNTALNIATGLGFGAASPIIAAGLTGIQSKDPDVQKMLEQVDSKLGLTGEDSLANSYNGDMTFTGSKDNFKNNMSSNTKSQLEKEKKRLEDITAASATTTAGNNKNIDKDQIEKDTGSKVVGGAVTTGILGGVMSEMIKTANNNVQDMVNKLNTTSTVKENTNTKPETPAPVAPVNNGGYTQKTTATYSSNNQIKYRQTDTSPSIQTTTQQKPTVLKPVENIKDTVNKVTEDIEKPTVTPDKVEQKPSTPTVDPKPVEPVKKPTIVTNDKKPTIETNDNNTNTNNTPNTNNTNNNNQQIIPPVNNSNNNVSYTPKSPSNNSYNTANQQQAVESNNITSNNQTTQTTPNTTTPSGNKNIISIDKTPKTTTIPKSNITPSKSSGGSNIIPIGLGVGAAAATAIGGATIIKKRMESQNTDSDYDSDYADEENYDGSYEDNTDTYNNDEETDYAYEAVSNNNEDDNVNVAVTYDDSAIQEQEYENNVSYGSGKINQLNLDDGKDIKISSDNFYSTVKEELE